MNKYEQMDLAEVIEKWQDEHKLNRLEGTRGVNGFQKLCGALGYKEGNYLGYGNEIINFLSDNSGAIEALITWISEQNVPEWKENLLEEIEELPECESEENEDNS
jgi:hypothetical protein